MHHIMKQQHIKANEHNKVSTESIKVRFIYLYNSKLSTFCRSNSFLMYTLQGHLCELQENVKIIEKKLVLRSCF